MTTRLSRRQIRELSPTMRCKSGEDNSKNLQLSSFLANSHAFLTALRLCNVLRKKLNSHLHFVMATIKQTEQNVTF